MFKCNLTFAGKILGQETTVLGIRKALIFFICFIKYNTKLYIILSLITRMSQTHVIIEKTNKTTKKKTHARNVNVLAVGDIFLPFSVVNHYHHHSLTDGLSVQTNGFKRKKFISIVLKNNAGRGR